jgi:tetratricopeptide (TPR) repeat protein
MARINWGRALQFQGDYAGVQTRLDEVLTLVRGAAGRLVHTVGERRLESVALGQLGILARQVGRYSDARNYYDQALRLARNAGDRMMEIAMLNNCGDIERYLGNYSTALELLATGRRVCQDTGHNVNEAYVLCTMSQIASVCGELTQAFEWADQASVIAVQIKERDLEAAIQCVRGHALAGLGRPDEASAAYLASLARYREIGRPTMVSEPLAGLARIALAQGLTDNAMNWVTEIVSYVDGGGGFDGTEDPLWIYLTCHQVLRAAQSPRSIEFLRRGHDLLLLRAGLLSDTECAGFLDNVPSHRAILAAWESIGAP